MFLPSYGEQAANVLDVSHVHAIVGDYADHKDLPGHERVPENLQEIFANVHEVVSRIRR